jgi:hypothetical protein
MRLWFMAIKERDIHRLKKCLRVSKTLDHHHLVIDSISLVVFVEETTSKYVNYLNVIFYQSTNALRISTTMSFLSLTISNLKGEY